MLCYYSKQSNKIFWKNKAKVLFVDVTVGVVIFFATKNGVGRQKGI